MIPKANHLDLAHCVGTDSHLVAGGRMTVVAAVTVQLRMIEEFAGGKTSRWRQK